MTPSLGGLTGGTALGSTTVAVDTNDIAGYNMTIFASSSVGMIGNASSTNNIPAYVTATSGLPDYTFNPPAHSARFGYNVTAASSTDVTQMFLSNGSSPCGTGSTMSSLHCWIAATTTAVTIINRNLPTAVTGASTTLSFEVQITSNPNPQIPNDTYVATTTLTAYSN